MEENEFGGLDDESPPPDHNSYIPPSMSTMAPASMRMGGMPGVLGAPNQMMSSQLLQQPI